MGKSEFTFRYKVRNWPAYNQALVHRGQLTLWFDERAIAAWRDTTPCTERGRPKIYADAAIECALILKLVFHLSLRATQGFLGSVVTLMRLELPVPDYSNHEPPADGVSGEPAADLSFGRSAHRRGFDRLEGLWRGGMACGKLPASRPKGLAEAALGG